MKYIDTHTHIYAQEFREDIDDVMERALLAGMWKAVLPATDEASAEEAVAQAKQQVLVEEIRTGAKDILGEAVDLGAVNYDEGW